MIRIYKDGELRDEELLKRNAPRVDVAGVVSAILRDVREHGDAAVLKYTEKFDGAKLETMLVTEEEIAEAMAETEPAFLDTLRLAERNIREYHEKQLRQGYSFTRPGGVVMGQKILPIERAGLYVPAGTAPYPSTVMMDAVPAKIAGCAEIIMCTPCRPDGKVNAAILAAAQIAGVTRIFKAGGAQAVAAMAYGTESVPRVDKIVGPGNAYVAEAKRQVYGKVSIDTIAGPSEVLVVADKTANPRHVAADMLAQAEHDVLSCCILVTDSETLAHAVQAEIEKQLESLERVSIARPSIDDNGKIILAENLRRARARSSSARTARSRWATISAARTTPCPPPARRASEARSAWTTSSKRSSTPITRRRHSRPSPRRSPALRIRRGSRATPEAPSSAWRRGRHEPLFQ